MSKYFNLDEWYTRRIIHQSSHFCIIRTHLLLSIHHSNIFQTYYQLIKPYLCQYQNLILLFFPTRRIFLALFLSLMLFLWFVSLVFCCTEVTICCHFNKSQKETQSRLDGIWQPKDEHFYSLSNLSEKLCCRSINASDMTKREIEKVFTTEESYWEKNTHTPTEIHSDTQQLLIWWCRNDKFLPECDISEWDGRKHAEWKISVNDCACGNCTVFECKMYVGYMPACIFCR